MKLHNHFDIYIEKNNVLEKVGHAENVVLNAYYATVNSWGFPKTDYLYVGTGTTVPDVTNTGLAVLLNKRPSVTMAGSYNEEEKFFTRNVQVEYGVTELNGSFITEVGIGDYSYLYTRALIKDNNGNPISIEKKSDERLIIYATMYIYRETYTKDLLACLGPAYSVTAGAHDVAMILSSTDAGVQGNCHVYGRHYMKGNGLCKYIARGAKLYEYAGPSNNGLVKSSASTSFVDTGEGSGINFFGVNFISDIICSPAHSRVGYYGVLRGVEELNIQNLTAMLGTGDGVKTNFPIKNFNAKNVSCLVNGVQESNVLIKSMANNESVRIIDPYVSGMLGAYYANGYDNALPIAYSEPIAYLEGVIQISDRSISNNKILCLYSHLIDEELFVEFIEINAPIELACVPNYGSNVNGHNMLRPSAPILLPDGSGLTFYYNGMQKIFKYDSTTGLIGSMLLNFVTSSSILFTQDMQHAMLVSTVSTYLGGNYVSQPLITLYDITRTADSLTLTEPSSPITLSPKGQSTDGPYITGGGDPHITSTNQFKVYITNYASTYKVDWITRTIVLATVPDITNYAIGNDFVARKPSDTSLQIGRRAADNVITWLNIIEDATLASCEIHCLYDKDDHISITWAGVNNASNPNGMMLQVVDNIAYNINMHGTGGYSPIWHSYTIGNMKFICYNREVPRIILPDKMSIEFSTPPAAGATVGAKYDLDYVPKDINWTLGATYTLNLQRG